jgi:periplasmic protein TonB
VFRIDAPIDDGRSEPLLAPTPGQAGRRPLLSWSPPPLAADVPAEGRREPGIPSASAVPVGSPPFPEREPPVGSASRRRPFGPIGSLLLHLLPLLLLLDWSTRRPPEIAPIPVQLVFEPQPAPPPPRPKPAPKQQLKPERRRPLGRIASESMGSPGSKGRDQSQHKTSLATKPPASSADSPLEATQQTAFFPPPPPLPTPTKLALPKPPEPDQSLAPKSSPKSSQLVRRTRPSHFNPRPGRFPGPAATRDEYLAYLAYLARQHIGLLSRSLVDGRRGETIINVLVLDNGTVAMLNVGLSSGYPEIDQRVEQMIRAVGRFPPLPQWFQGPSMMLQFRLEFPEALDD